jgi:uncharacterized phage-like protein YoqJ
MKLDAIECCKNMASWDEREKSNNNFQKKNQFFISHTKSNTIYSIEEKSKKIKCINFVCEGKNEKKT